MCVKTGVINFISHIIIYYCSTLKPSVETQQYMMAQDNLETFVSMANCGEKRFEYRIDSLDTSWTAVYAETLHKLLIV